MQIGLVGAALVVTPGLAIAAPPTPPGEAAPASNWSAAMPPAALGSYVPAQSKVMVVEAGDVSGDREEVARAVQANLTASGGPSLVMDDGALGDQSASDDKAITEAAKGMGVDQVAVVRVFPGAPGSPGTAVVTFYSEPGTAFSAFTLTPDQVLAPRGGAGVAAGVDPAAETNASAVVGANADRSDIDKEAAVRRFKREYLWFEDFVGYRADTGQVVARWSEIKKGKSGLDVKGKEFYDLLDRADLKKRYKQRRGARWGLIGGGTALAVGGFAGWMSLFLRDQPDFGGDDPIGPGSAPSADAERNSWIVLGAVAGPGIVAAIVGSFIKPHPITPNEAKRLAEDYNLNLLEKLGLEESDVAVTGMGPMLTRGGGGVSLAGEF